MRFLLSFLIILSLNRVSKAQNITKELDSLRSNYLLGEQYYNHKLIAHRFNDLKTELENSKLNYKKFINIRTGFTDEMMVFKNFLATNEGNELISLKKLDSIKFDLLMKDLNLPIAAENFSKKVKKETIKKFLDVGMILHNNWNPIKSETDKRIIADYEIYSLIILLNNNIDQKYTGNNLYGYKVIFKDPITILIFKNYNPIMLNDFLVRFKKELKTKISQFLENPATEFNSPIYTTTGKRISIETDNKSFAILKVEPVFNGD